MLLYLFIIIVLFGLVNSNFRSNQNKLHDRKGRNFRENYERKKEARKEQDS